MQTIDWKWLELASKSPLTVWHGANPYIASKYNSISGISPEWEFPSGSFQTVIPEDLAQEKNFSRTIVFVPAMILPMPNI